MKYLIALICFVVISCSTSNNLPNKVDANTYNLIVNIRVHAIHYKTQCDDYQLSSANIKNLKEEVAFFEKYNEHLPNNSFIQKEAVNLNTVVEEFYSRYNSSNTPSKSFCEIKFDIIEHDADTIQTMIGNRLK